MVRAKSFPANKNVRYECFQCTIQIFHILCEICSNLDTFVILSTKVDIFVPSIYGLYHVIE